MWPSFWWDWHRKKIPGDKSPDFHLHYREWWVQSAQQTLKYNAFLFKSQRCLWRLISTRHLLRHPPVHTKWRWSTPASLPKAFTQFPYLAWHEHTTCGLWWINIPARTSLPGGPTLRRALCQVNALLSLSWNSSCSILGLVFCKWRQWGLGHVCKQRRFSRCMWPPLSFLASPVPTEHSQCPTSQNLGTQDARRKQAQGKCVTFMTE